MTALRNALTGVLFCLITLQPLSGTAETLGLIDVWTTTSANPLVRDVAGGPNGLVYAIADSRVWIFDFQGNLLGFFSGFGSPVGPLVAPTGIATSQQGLVFVTDESTNLVVVFDLDGNFLNAWGGTGSLPGQFDRARGVDVDDSGQVVHIADGDNHRIQTFSFDGSFIRQWGSLGSGPGQFSEPKDVGVAPGGDVYVADANNNRIQRFDANGAYLGDWGSPGNGPGLFGLPNALAVDDDGLVYAGGGENDDIQIFDPNGNYIETLGFGVNGIDMGSPTGVEVAADGTVYVANSSKGNFLKIGVLEPSILSISDVGNDQGRSVRVQFTAAGRDGPSVFPVQEYDVFRRIDPLPGTLAKATWDFVGTVPAYGEPDYAAVVPTLADSTVTDGMHWSVFKIRAAESEPLAFAESAPDSGYSLDNLAPSAPSMVTVESGALTWSSPTDDDFDYFNVYGSETGLPDDPLTLLGQTVGQVWNLSGSAFAFFGVSATDFSGNEGLVRFASHATTSAPAPRVASLDLHPNPFNPRTTIRFVVGKTGLVELYVVDPRGRRRDTLIAGETRTSGSHELAYSPRLESGVYFLVLETGGETLSTKMSLVR